MGEYSAPGPLVKMENVLVRRQHGVALWVSRLEIHEGETLAVVGPNGAGKSTLLLVLARLLKITSGEIYFKGKPFREWNELEYRRSLGFVFQEALLLDMSVAENVALGLKFRQLPGGEVHARVERWLKALGIEALAGRRAGELSGGEAQRVSLARALALEPRLFLLDEPFSALDQPSRLQLINDVAGLLKQDHRTTLFITHDLNEAAILADRMAVILSGELQQVGTVEEVFHNPANERVQAFVGFRDR
ncbi:MAG TPA: ABC transporter [Anaerolinea thermolimosa]|uniref:ABC transporter n=1 Tax=Anaerolinea thermolimosa TaxID=229919 RepID=A0A3D1JJG8_9CHLR|nr:ABC transporter [Anaerolinea thermolimosa]